MQTFEGWSAHQDQSNGQTEHHVVANATRAAGGEVAVGLPVAPGKEITFRARHGTLLRARAIDDGELLLEHRVGRVRMVAEAPADAHAHAFGLDDSDEWRSNLPPPKPLAKPPSSAPGAKKPPRAAPVKPGKLKEDHRFQVAFLNHLPVPLDLYYYAPKEGTETLQSRAAPFETLQIVTRARRADASLMIAATPRPRRGQSAEATPRRGQSVRRRRRGRDADSPCEGDATAATRTVRGGNAVAATQTVRRGATRNVERRAAGTGARTSSSATPSRASARRSSLFP